jgi:TatD family-associated radical SAM protein
MYFEGYNLNLSGAEPSARQVLDEIYKQLAAAPAREIVFCGYGEPTMRLDVLLHTARELKREIAAGALAPFKIRLNTIGLANIVHGRDVTGELASVVDKINISINSPDKQEWLRLVRPLPQYADKGYESVLDFIRLCAQKTEEVVVSIVARQGIDAEKTEELARSLGAKFYLREFIDDK